MAVPLTVATLTVTPRPLGASSVMTKFSVRVPTLPSTIDGLLDRQRGLRIVIGDRAGALRPVDECASHIGNTDKEGPLVLFSISPLMTTVNVAEVAPAGITTPVWLFAT